MRILNTVQKIEKLNNVVVLDEKGPGNTNHLYVVEDMDANEIATIQFQEGPRKYDTSVHGVLDTDLLEIVRDRLICFQSGEFACDDNTKALEHIEIALMYLNKRVMDRYERNVLGTNNK